MGHFKSAESATIAHGIVKPSKSFSIFTGIALVVGIFFLTLKRFAKTEDQSPLFVVLAAAFLLTAVFLFLYTKRFQIIYDETGFTVRTLFRKSQTYSFADVEAIACKEDSFLLRTKQGNLRLEKELYLGAEDFLAQLQNHVSL